ncbi:MAG: HesA/MoeB/ThiF family protein [Candidatus Methanofastidiosia archaeon]|jgi:adenylyltransferase/sulfurtransferase
MNRYSRNILLSQIGEKGQIALNKSAVTIIGCGGLGSTISEHVTRAGVGDITIVDKDIVEIHNLQRQHLYTESDIGTPKVKVAEKRLQQINSEITIRGFEKKVTRDNIEDLIKKRDIVIDGTDNLDTRYIINDACIKHGIPWVYGACVAVNGMTMAILPEGPCLRCVLPQIPSPESIPTSDTVGILNVLPSIMGGLQATTTIKYLVGDRIDTRLTIVDMWEQDLRKVIVSQRKACPCCVQHEFEFLE